MVCMRYEYSINSIFKLKIYLFLFLSTSTVSIGTQVCMMNVHYLDQQKHTVPITTQADHRQKCRPRPATREPLFLCM